MPFFFVLSILLAVAAIVTVLVSHRMPETVAARHDDGYAMRGREPTPMQVPSLRKPLRYTAITCAVLALLCLFISCIKVVSTKNEGVLTSFGATAGKLSNGLHFTWPWQQVTEMDAAIQTDKFLGHDCVDVRIANQQTACVDVSIRWRIRPDSVDELFKDYRSFEHVRDSLVTRELTAAVNEQMADYNPLNSIKTGTPSSGGPPNPTTAELAKRITEQMQSEIGSQINVINTIIPLIKFDPQTQSRINQLQQQIALTRIAEQEYQTNKKQAQANDALSASVNSSPNVLVSQCLGILNTMVKNGQNVPPGFSCWPGAGVAGIIAQTSGK